MSDFKGFLFMITITFTEEEIKEILINGGLDEEDINNMFPEEIKQAILDQLL